MIISAPRSVWPSASSDCDLVLMDMLMPVMGGEECVRLIRRHLRRTDLPVIGLSAAGFIEDRDRCIAAGMNDYLTKPIEFDRLIEMIGRHTKPKPQ